MHGWRRRVTLSTTAAMAFVAAAMSPGAGQGAGPTPGASPAQVAPAPSATPDMGLSPTTTLGPWLSPGGWTVAQARRSSVVLSVRLPASPWDIGTPVTAHITSDARHARPGMSVGDLPGVCRGLSMVVRALASPTDGTSWTGNAAAFKERALAPAFPTDGVIVGRIVAAGAGDCSEAPSTLLRLVRQQVTATWSPGSAAPGLVEVVVALALLDGSGSGEPPSPLVTSTRAWVGGAPLPVGPVAAIDAVLSDPSYAELVAAGSPSEWGSLTMEPDTTTTGRRTWSVVLTTTDGAHRYEAAVDADTGAVTGVRDAT